MKVGVIGLGKMGVGIAAKLLDGGHDVVVWNRSEDASLEFKSQNPKAEVAESIENLVKSLPLPKILWIMVSAAAVAEVLSEVKKFVKAGDVVIDGGNSHYKDTEKRFDELEGLRVHFLGIGVSGGILASKNGFPLMVGGSLAGYELIKPILDSLSKPASGHEYFGTGGAGHFVKMVHNGIEYGMMQSIGEGFAVLEKSDYGLDLPKVASVWEKGTVISGLLMNLISEKLDKEPNLDSFEGIVGRSGEGDWTLEAAASEDLALPAIESAVYFRKDSEADENIQRSFTARVLNALRAAFGGHEVKK